MPRAFEASVSSPASVEQVHAAFGARQYWLARFDAFDVSCTLDELHVDDETVHVSATQDLRHNGLPGPIAAFYRSDLLIRNTETWQRVDGHRVHGEINVDVVGAPGSGSGSAVLEPDGDGSHLRFTGTVEFKVPLVGGGVEKFLAHHFAKQIPEIQRFTTAWIAGG